MSWVELTTIRLRGLTVLYGALLRRRAWPLLHLGGLAVALAALAARHGSTRPWMWIAFTLAVLAPAVWLHLGVELPSHFDAAAVRAQKRNHPRTAQLFFQLAVSSCSLPGTRFGSGGPMEERRAIALYNLGSFLLQAGQSHRAERNQVKAARAFRNLGPSLGTPGLVLALNAWGVCCRERGAPEEALVHFKEALALTASGHLKARDHRALALYNVAETLYAAEGDLRQAWGLLEDCLQLLRDGDSADDPELLDLARELQTELRSRLDERVEGEDDTA